MRRPRPLPEHLSDRAFSVRDVRDAGVSAGRLDAGDLAIPYPLPLKEIVFGLRCSDDDMKAIRDAVRQGPFPDVRLRRVVERQGSYEYDVQDMS